MVQSKPRLVRPCDPGRGDRAEAFKLAVKEREAGDDYWKIGLAGWPTLSAINRFLEEHRYPPTQDRNEGLLLAERADRGLLYYGDKKLPVLRQFVRDRHLGLGIIGRSKDAQLLENLQDADDSAEFAGFTKLPPELRVSIYELYFSWLTIPENPTQPPICKTSALVRKESLPVFYSTCSFMVMTSIFHSIPTLNRFILKTSADNLSCITKFTIYTLFGPRAMPCTLKIDLRAEADATSVFTLISPQGHQSGDQGCKGTRARAVINRIAARSGGQKLVLADIRETCQTLRFESILVGGPCSLRHLARTINRTR